MGHLWLHFSVKKGKYLLEKFISGHLTNLITEDQGISAVDVKSSSTCVEVGFLFSIFTKDHCFQEPLKNVVIYFVINFKNLTQQLHFALNLQPVKAWTVSSGKRAWHQMWM